jgi:hypothetical protein
VHSVLFCSIASITSIRTTPDAVHFSRCNCATGHRCRARGTLLLDLGCKVHLGSISGRDVIGSMSAAPQAFLGDSLNRFVYISAGRLSSSHRKSSVTGSTRTTTATLVQILNRVPRSSSRSFTTPAHLLACSTHGNNYYYMVLTVSEFNHVSPYQLPVPSHQVVAHNACFGVTRRLP